MPDKIPCLTGGILFGLILEARKSKTRVRKSFLEQKTDGLSETDMMKSFITIFTGGLPSTPYESTFKKNVSDYKKCIVSSTTYLPFDDQTFVDSFRYSIEQNKKDKLESISVFINEKLSEQKLRWLVSAIIETISEDETIDESEHFKISIKDTVSKLEIANVRTVEIEPFLLSVMCYVFVNKIDNILGKFTFEAWYSQSGANTQWKFSNTKLGISFQELEIIRYNSKTAQTDTIEELEYFEEGQSDTEEEVNHNMADDEPKKQQVLNNPKILNQYANNIYNIERVENLN